MENEFDTRGVRGRGRPKKVDDGIRLHIWVSGEENRMLDEMSEASGKSKSDLIRRSVELYYYISDGKW